MARSEVRNLLGRFHLHRWRSIRGCERNHRSFDRRWTIEAAALFCRRTNKISRPLRSTGPRLEGQPGSPDNPRAAGAVAEYSLDHRPGRALLERALIDTRTARARLRLFHRPKPRRSLFRSTAGDSRPKSRHSVALAGS